MDTTIIRKTPKVQRISKPEIKTFIKFSQGVPLVEALRKVNAENGVIVSNKRHDQALKSGEYKMLREVYPCWTGTMCAYEMPNKNLEKEIVYIDEKRQKYIFLVPEEFMGEKNSILVANDCYFELVKNKHDLIVSPEPGKVDLVPNFPIENGWYQTEKKYGIPIGKKISPYNSEAKYLFRLDSARVGFVVRGYYNANIYNNRMYDMRGIYLDISPSTKLGVALEG